MNLYVVSSKDSNRNRQQGNEVMSFRNFQCRCVDGKEEQEKQRLSAIFRRKSFFCKSSLYIYKTALVK